MADSCGEPPWDQRPGLTGDGPEEHEVDSANDPDSTLNDAGALRAKENTSGPPHRHSVAEKETRSFQRVFGTRLGLNAWRQQCFRNVAGDVLAQIFSDESQREINTGTHAA